MMERLGEPLNNWRFSSGLETLNIKVTPALISNDGDIIRHWALSGAGIAYKSIWDVKHDLATGKLLTLLDGFVLGFQASDNEKTELQLVYPSRQYAPRQVSGFIDSLLNRLSED